MRLLTEISFAIVATDQLCGSRHSESGYSNMLTGMQFYWEYMHSFLIKKKKLNKSWYSVTQE